VLFLFVSVSAVQNGSAQAAARTNVYHVHFAKATLGKGAEEGDYRKKQCQCSVPSHYIVLRHQSGEDWDYAVINLSEPKPPLRPPEVHLLPVLVI
jgi:dihydroorotase-like cyclic amidohydrolase